MKDFMVLNNGMKIPSIGFGPMIVGYTSKWIISKNFFEKVSNRLQRPFVYNQYVNAVANAFNLGLTHLDYSSAYGDGHLIGKAIKRSGVKREELFITTRVNNTAQRKGLIKECLLQQIQGMGLAYVDLFMFHWPVPDLYIETWKEMINLQKEGLCKSIGVANCHIHHIEELYNETGIMPQVNQVEVHPLLTQKPLIAYCKSKGILVEGYTALARMDDRLVRLPLIQGLAKKYNKTITQIIIRWHLQCGVLPVVRSMNKKHQEEIVDVFDFELTDDEILAIDGVNINARLRFDPDNCDYSIL